MIPVILLADLFIFRKQKLFFTVIMLSGLAVAAWFLFVEAGWIGSEKYTTAFSGMIRIDGIALVFKILFILSGFLFIFLSLIESKPRKFRSEAEYFIIFLGILLGSMLMVMSSSLMMVYISIELVSLSSYMLSVFNFDRKSVESGLKYILFGAVSSAIMLYGISLLYGFTGTLNIFSGEFIEKLNLVPPFPAFMALIMMFSGLLFKMAVVPFHIWTPDVYEGAPVSLIAFFSIVPKLAGLVIFGRLFYLLNEMPGNIEWVTVFGFLAIVTMFIGNLAALRQNDPKRMMAYSSIAHSGYLMVGIIAMNILGLQSVAIHAFVYLVMNFLVFLVIEMLTPPAGPASIPDYSGWFRHVPVLAVLMLVGFISLTGLPPTGGFTSKMMLFSSAWYSYAEGGNKIMLWLIILGLLNTVISLFYYLRIPYYMIFREAADAPIQVPSQRNGFIGLGIFLAALIIIVFIKPDWLADMLNSLNFTYPEITE